MSSFHCGHSHSPAAVVLLHSQLPTYHSRPYQMDPPGANNAAAGPSTSAGAVNAGAGPSTSAGAVNAGAGPSTSAGAVNAGAGPSTSAGAVNAGAGPSTSAGAVNAGAGPSTSAGAVNAAPFSYMVRELLLAYVGNLHDVTHDSHPPSLPTYTHRLMMTI